jgi:hypothetical protein
METDQLMTAVCLRAIRSDPKRFASAYVRRFVNYWRCVVNRFPSVGPAEWRPDGFDGQKVRRSPLAARVLTPVLSNTAARCLWMNELVAASVFAGVAGVLVRSETRRYGLAVGLLLLYFAAVTAAVEIENYRYRMVVEPAMIIAVVCGMMNLFSLKRRPTHDAGAP